MKKGLQEDLQVIEGIGDIFFKKRNVKPKSLSIAGKWSLVVSFT